MRPLCLYLALLLCVGLIGVGAVELWLRFVAVDFARSITTDRTTFCFMVSSVSTPLFVGMVAGWKEWNGPYYIAASAAIGAIYGNHVGTTLAATAFGTTTYVLTWGMHRMMTMKNPQAHITEADEDREMVINEAGELVYEDEIAIPLQDELTEEETNEEEFVFSDDDTPPDADDLEAYSLTDSLHVIDAKGLIKRLEREGLNFYVKAPHYDPAGGDSHAASQGTSGHHAFVDLYVYWEHYERYFELRDQHYKAQTEDDGSSLLEAFRSFGVNKDLDDKVQDGEQPNNKDERPS